MPKPQHSFPSDLLDGYAPASTVLTLPDGSMYGTTQYGGAAGLGTVWKIDASGNYSILHSFTGTVSGDAQDSDGDDPVGGLCLGADGNLYGTTAGGGSALYGTIYEISTSGDYSLLVSLNAPMSAPTGLTITVTSPTCVTLNWNLEPGAGSYNIKRSSTPGGPFTTVGNTLSNSYEDCSLTSSTAYYYEVVPVLDGVEGPPTMVLSVTPSGAPAGPADLTATPGPTTITLNWSAVANAISYTVQRSLVSGGPYTAIASVDAPAVTYEDTGLTNGLTYYYVVNATTPVGATQNSNQAYATPSTPGPLNLVGIAGNGQVSLTWDAYTPVTNYRVKRSLNNSGPWDIIATPTTNSQVDDSVENGTTYYYTISAISNGVETANSNVVSVTPQYPASNPADLTATPGNAQVSLSWENVDSSVTSFNIYRSTTSGSGYTLLTPVSVTSSGTGSGGYAFVDQTAQNFVTYYYVVTGVNPIGESGYSNQASAEPLPPPAAPIDLSATPGDKQVNLAWEASDPLTTTYTLYRGTQSGGPYVIVDTVILPGAPTIGEVATYTDAGIGILNVDGTYGLENGTEYYYVVAASGVGGSSSNSNEANATPYLPAPTAPDALRTSSGDGQVNLIWDESQYASSYNIYRSASGSSYNLLVNVPIGDPEYADTSVTDGTQYSYYVTGLNASAESTPSPSATAQPGPALSQAAQVIQVATAFCQAIGQPVTATATTQFPAPLQTAVGQEPYWQPRWLVTFPGQAEVEVVDGSSLVNWYYDYAVNNMTGPAGTAEASSAALQTFSTVLTASGQDMSELGTPTVTEE